MSENGKIRGACYVLVATTLVFLAARFLGAHLFDNNWSFIHWRHLPGWYPAAWLGGLVLAALLLTVFLDRIAKLFVSRLPVLIAAAVLFGLLVLFQCDSFLYGGGNLRIAQITQVPRVMFRWFEFGTVGVVASMSRLIGLFDLHYNAVGVYSWKVFAFACSFLSLTGSLVLVKELTDNAVRRFCLFVVVFFGPQTILYFGFVGAEPVVVAISLWFAAASVRINRRFTFKRLMALWALTVIGIVCHVGLVYLVPAAIYVTARHAVRSDRGRVSLLPLAVGLVAYLVLVVVVFYWGNRSIELSKYLLFLHGKSPFGDYGLFSLRHVGDVLQVFFLAAPTFLVSKYLWIQPPKRILSNGNLVTASLMVLAGNTTMAILDPLNSIPFDFPRLVAYLTPLGFLLAVLTSDISVDGRAGRRLLGFLAVVSILVPLSYLPTYLKIDNADAYATEYFEKHDFFYMSGCLAFRDAYFYRKEFSKADTWEWKLPTKSPDFLNLRGANDLAVHNEVNKAIKELYLMTAKHRYWTDARAVLASLLIRARQYDQARAEIDSALMLEPYRKEHLVNLYIYYRETKDYHKALMAAERALEIYPGDDDIMTDLMIISFRANLFDTADSLATVLLETDSTLPYPYLIRGFLADARKDVSAAVSCYEKFISLAPQEAEVPRVRKRLNDLVMQLREEQ